MLSAPSIPDCRDIQFPGTAFASSNEHCPQVEDPAVEHSRGEIRCENCQHTDMLLSWVCPQFQHL